MKFAIKHPHRAVAVLLMALSACTTAPPSPVDATATQPRTKAGPRDAQVYEQNIPTATSHHCHDCLKERVSNGSKNEHSATRYRIGPLVIRLLIGHWPRYQHCRIRFPRLCVSSRWIPRIQLWRSERLELWPLGPWALKLFLLGCEPLLHAFHRPVQSCHPACGRTSTRFAAV
jgi:hypothetical protein